MFSLLNVQTVSAERGNCYDDDTRIAQITTAGDVDDLLRHPSLTSQRRSNVVRELFPVGPGSDDELLVSFLSSWPVFSDGPFHDLVRRELGRGLRELAGDGLADSIACEASALVDAMTTDSCYDWMASVARPLSTAIVRRLLPTDDDVLSRTIVLSQIVMDSLALPKMDRDAAVAALRAGQELATLLQRELLHGDGSLSRTLRRLYEMPECGLAGATGALAQVVTGSLDPIVAAVGALPVVMSADPGPLPAASWREEILRLSSPFRLTARVATDPVRVGDVMIRPGDRVVLQLGAANLDPAVHDQPTRPAVRSQSAKHLAFGAGPHYCPGAPIARAALDGLLAAMKTRTLFFDVRHVTYRPGTFLRFAGVDGALAHGDRIS